jgi:prophage antirepressor-like protein
MKIVYRTYTEKDVGFFILKDGHNFWFEADVVAGFFKYEYPSEICFKIRPETWEKLGKLNTGDIDAPQHWKHNTELISEVGFLRLLSKSNLPQSKVNEFERWLFDDVILSLREVDQYMLSKSYHDQLIAKDKEIIKLHDKILEVKEKNFIRNGS